MRRKIIKDCMCVATMDATGSVLSGCDVEITGNTITRIGKNIETNGAQVISGTGRITLPGFVNTHHHFYQTLTRNLKPVQDAGLFEWLTFHYNIWKNITPEAIYESSRLAIAELLLTGCTTGTDHLYLVPSMYQKKTKEFFGEEVRAAGELGFRFFLGRGSMSRGRSHGGLPPDETVESEKSILKSSEEIISSYHDSSEFSMLSVYLGPCSPFSVTPELMKDSAKLARAKKVLLHTHLGETKDEEVYCLEKHGRRPFELMEELGWVGDDVWYAHGIHFNDAEIKKIGATRTGISHCPTSNMRLGSGIASIPALLDAGARVGLGVDGSASADSSNMLRELKHALLVHRIGTAVNAMPAWRVLRMATKGGAEVLGRKDIGSIEVGKAADIAIFDLNKIDYVGALHDPVAALLFCGTEDRANTVIVNGEIVVRDKKLLRVDEDELIRAATKESQKLIGTL